MVIDEVFPNPTVKQVAFEIRFPNLFYIEDKISDLQFKVMNKFPESELILDMPLAFINRGQKSGFQPPPNFGKDFGVIY